MKKTARKILSFVLAFVLAFGAVPMESTASEIAEAGEDMLQQALYLISKGNSEKELFDSGTATTPETVTVEEAAERLAEFIGKFEGKFFTADGTYCAEGTVHATECDNCLMSNVIKADWVRELVGMGELNASLCPTQYSYSGKQGSADGWQCFGFANFVHWYVFAQKNTDRVTSVLEATGPMTYETIKNALPGDVIRSNYYGGHSMVFISCDEEGFTVIDSNFSIKYACQVKVHTMKYNSSYNVAITGTKNYDRTVECKHEYSEEITAPTCTEQGYTTHTCTICGESYTEGETDALGHDCEEIVTEPTCYEEGYTTISCKRCGYSEIKTIEIDITERFSWTEGKMIIATTGEFKDYEYWMASDYTDISGCNFIVIKTANTASVNTSTGLAFYDADKNYISGIVHTDKSGIYGTLIHELEVPENAAYIRTTYYSNTHPNYEEKFGEFYCRATVDERIPKVEHSFSSWDTLTEPSATEPGEEKRNCENCGYSETREIPPKGYATGDLNLDGSVDVMDAYYARLVAAKLVVPTEQQMLLGDIDGDGKITAVDANYIRKFAAKIITALPVEQ